MKIFYAFSIVLLFLLTISPTNIMALELGTNITVYDGSSSSIDRWWGAREDDEVEPGCEGSQSWDLEGFFLGESGLNVVGGFDFENGNGDFEIGDIFIDTDGIFDPYAYTMAGNGNVDVANNFGYEYVLDLDMNNHTYKVYDISKGATTSTVYFKINQHSNAFRYVSGGEEVGGGSFNYWSGLRSEEVNGLSGAEHYAMTGFDLGFIAGQDFTAHLTLGCGNDNLMGHGTAPVPEPATLFLMGSGLIALGGFGKRKMKKG